MLQVCQTGTIKFTPSILARPLYEGFMPNHSIYSYRLYIKYRRIFFPSSIQTHVPAAVFVYYTTSTFPEAKFLILYKAVADVAPQLRIGEEELLLYKARAHNTPTVFCRKASALLASFSKSMPDLSLFTDHKSFAS